jgi:hypothetical protein
MTKLEYFKARCEAAEKFIGYLEAQPERDDMYKPQYQRILNKWQSLVNTPEPEEWISVKDKLPERSMNVLVTTNEGKVGVMWFDGILHWHVLKNEAKVTHWMYEPKPAHDGFMTDDDLEKHELIEG